MARPNVAAVVGVKEARSLVVLVVQYSAGMAIREFTVGGRAMALLNARDVLSSCALDEFDLDALFAADRGGLPSSRRYNVPRKIDSAMDLNEVADEGDLESVGTGGGC